MTSISAVVICQQRVYFMRLCICDSLWRKIKPPLWNCNFREEGKRRVEIRHLSLQRTNQGVQCPTRVPGEVSLPSTAGFLLCESARLCGWCKCWPAKSVSTECLWGGRRRLAFCWQTLSYGLLISCAWLIYNRVLSLPQRSVGVGKTNRPAGWQEWGSSPPHSALWTLLKGDLLQMSPFAKADLWGAERDKEG